MFEKVPEQLRIAGHVRQTLYYDDCKVFIDAVFEIANKFQLSLNELPSARVLPLDRRTAFRVMLGLLTQNVYSLILIAKAASEGFIDDMHVIKRVMYERHLNLKLIGSDPVKRGPQYLHSQAISELRWLERSENPNSNVDLKEILADAPRIRREASQFMRDYFPDRKTPPQYWHGKKLPDAAKEAGLDYSHELSYGYMSEYAHAQGYSIPVDSASTPVEVFRNHASSELVRDVLSSAVALFLRGWEELSRRFQPGELGQIKLLLENYAKKAFPGEHVKTDM